MPLCNDMCREQLCLKSVVRERLCEQSVLLVDDCGASPRAWGWSKSVRTGLLVGVESVASFMTAAITVYAAIK